MSRSVLSKVLATAVVAILAACGSTAGTLGGGSTAGTLGSDRTADLLSGDTTAGTWGGVQICEHYDDDPIPPGYDENGCWSPTEYFERAPEVIPEVDDSAPVLRIEAAGDIPGGIEGELFFVRAISPTGRIVLDRDWEWPGMDQQVPPGAYQVTAYLRYCDGDCSKLDPPVRSCTVDILAEPSFTYTMTYDTNADGTVGCDAAIDES